MIKVLDLNCDMGESFGRYALGNDEAIMPLISSANIACGFHAGDPGVMAKTVKLALEYQVAVGAHPGLPDLVGFGRRSMAIPVEDIEQLVLYQIGALSAFIKAEGGKLHHVKPHGALYNMAADDRSVADAIARAVHRFDDGLMLYGLSGSEHIAAAEAIGLRVVREAFTDRLYQKDGRLAPRRENGVMTDCQQMLEQVRQLIQKGHVNTIDGHICAIEADTLCVHGDGVNALAYAQQLRSFLEEQHVTVIAPEIADPSQ